MLAITPTVLLYLTAAELGIREDEREALIAVRKMLADGKLKHVPNPEATGVACAFNMDAHGYGCGTPACIGGWMAVEMRRRQSCYVKEGRSEPLVVLFFPPWELNGKSLVWERLTPPQAARAADAFLSGAGARCWHIALDTEA